MPAQASPSTLNPMHYLVKAEAKVGCAKYLPELAEAQMRPRWGRNVGGSCAWCPPPCVLWALVSVDSVAKGGFGQARKCTVGHLQKSSRRKGLGYTPMANCHEDSGIRIYTVGQGCHAKVGHQARNLMPIVHGTKSGYTNYKCRCKDCKDAATAYWKSYAQTHKAQKFSSRQHGLLSTYRLGCRCYKCKRAQSKKNRAYRALTKQKARPTLLVSGQV